MKKKLSYIFILVMLTSTISAQTTIGLIQKSIGSVDDGYVLFAPMSSKNTFLIDKCGREVKTWISNYRPSGSCYLLNDGTLIRAGKVNNSLFNAGGSGGIIEKFDWNGNVIWSYTVSDAVKCQHHDLKVLPNGNVLVLAWEMKTAIDAVNQGRNPALIQNAVWSEQILEIQPIGSDSGVVVWEWHLWDHLVQDYNPAKPNYGQISLRPELINLNFKAIANNPDWIHINSIDYNPALDQIMLSAHSFDEIWIIDHSTTTTQAAGHTGGNSGMGGDIIYRWGNPTAYNVATPAQLFGQHNAHWIEIGLPYENQIMVFNNGFGSPGGNYSTIEIFSPPTSGFNYTSILPYLPNSTSWIYNSGNNNNFFAPNVSGAQQLSNGNVLFCDGPSGTFIEIDNAENIVWKYINPVSASGIMTQGTSPAQNVVFKCINYPSTYAGFSGHTLSSNSIIENTNPVSDSCNLVTATEDYVIRDAILVFPNPSCDFINIHINKPVDEKIYIEIFDLSGKLVLNNIFINAKKSYSLDLRTLNAGYYLLIASSSHFTYTKKIIIKE